MRKFLLFMLLVTVLAPVTLGQMTATIGSTACSPTHSQLPWYHLYDFSETQYGIPASQLGIFGSDPVTITEIGWYCCGTLPTGNYSLNVYLTERPSSFDLSTLGSNPVNNVSLGTLVASGKTLTGAGSEKMLTLDTPFLYTPGNHLIVTTCDMLSGWSSSFAWAGNTMNGNGLYRYRDGTAYDCNATTAESTGYVANIWMTTILGYVPPGATCDLTMLAPGGTGFGTTTPGVGTWLYGQNANAIISATPNAASLFDYWELDGAHYSYNANETVLMDIDHTVQAFFKPLGALALPFYEDFTGVATGAIPLHWDRTHTNWGAVASANAGGVAPEMQFYWSPSVTDEIRLITPRLDGTTASDILCSFKHHVSDYNSNYTLRVQTSIDSGATWQDQWSTPGGPWSGTLDIDMSDLAGEEFQIAIVFDGYSYNINYWYIDDFSVISNYLGGIQGVVTDDMGPIEGARVTVVETGEFAETDLNGEYAFPHMVGTYTVRCQALGHNAATEPNVVITYGTMTNLDFYLTYPVADIYPGSFFVQQELGDTQDEYLYIDNDGNGPLDYSIAIRYLKNRSRDVENWTPVTPTNTPAQWPGSCYGEGKFFVIAGLYASSTMSNATRIYDVASGTWSAGAPIPFGYDCAVTEYYNGKVYFVGGFDASFAASNRVQIYDIATDSWSQGATMPSARGGGSGGLIGGKIYLLGGSTDANFPTENIAYEYDIAGNSWTTLASGPISTYGIALGGGCAYNGKIYVGGHFSSAYYQFYEFDPAGGGVWTSKAAFPTGLGGQTVSLVGLETENIILAVGGGFDWTATGTTWSYDPQTDVWQNLNLPMTQSVLGGACAADEGNIFFYGGTTGSGPTDPAPFMKNSYSYSSWLTVDTNSGSVNPMDSAVVTLTFDAGQVPSNGVYLAELIVNNNFGDQTPVVIPATMVVGTAGELEGYVYDDGRAPLEGATVKILETGQTAVSAVDGFYNFPMVSAGLYTLTCSADGFITATEPDVEVIENSTTAVDFHLSQPIISVSPTAYTRYQAAGTIQTVSNALTVQNVGAGIMDWSSRIVYNRGGRGSKDVLVAVHIDGNTGWYNPGPAYAAAVTAAGYNATVISSPGSASIPFPTPFTANEYGVVIVLTSENFWASPQNLTPADEAALQAYQDTGGNVMLVGQDALQSTHSSWGTATGWFKTHLGLLSVDQDIWWDQQTITLTGAAGTFAEGLNFTVNGADAGGPFIANNFYADNLVPDTNAFVIWEGDGGGLTADVAIAFDNGATKAIFSTSELSAAGTTQDFYDAIEAIMGFLGSAAWLDTNPKAGSISAGGDALIDLTFDTTELENGEYHATVIYTNEIGNTTVSVDVTLFVGEPPYPVDPTNCEADPAEICVGDSAILTADSIYEIHWFDDVCGGNEVGIGPALTVSPLVTTTYYARAYDAGMDEWSDGCCDVEVIVNELPVATASNNSTAAVPLDEGDDLELAGGPDGMEDYYWEGPDAWTSTDQNPTRTDVDDTMAGVYTLTVTDANGCVGTATTTVYIGEPPPIPTMGVTGIGLLLLALGSLMSFARRRK